MKTQHIFILTLLALLTHDVCSQTASQNYIRTRTYTLATGSTYLDNIQYFDGLGRPLQTIQKGATPLGADLVTYREYDAYGRESNNWLPAVVASNNGAFVPFSTFTSKAAATYTGEGKPYSKPVYEASPLNRILQQYGPGQDWQNNNKAISTGYLANVAKTGTAFTIADSLACGLYINAGSGTTAGIYRTENYAASSLYATRLKDEENNTSYEFKDKLGQVVLTRQISEGKLHDTYYVYDDFGNLCCVLPPLAAEVLNSTSITSPWTDTNAYMQQYAYLYKYDNRNRCIAKKLPGADWTYYVYDKADRLVFTQDGEQRSRGEWGFTIPDALGRIALAGTCQKNMAYNSNPLGNSIVKTSSVEGTTAFKGYTVPTGVELINPVILSVNYYDNYNFIGYNNIPNSTDTQYTTESGYGVCYGTHQDMYLSKGLLTGTLTAQLLPDGTISPAYLYSVMYYDYRSRPVQTKSNNHLPGGLEKEYIAYNFTGQPVQRKHVHAATGKDTQTEVYSYTYDHAGRLKVTSHKLNTGTETLLANNEYDELGRLKANKRNGNAMLNSNYTYNIRSWTQSISNYHFIENLAYGYNGNIKTQRWEQANKTRMYAFAYDGLSRIKDATYSGDGAYGASYNYDKHGNITSLSRYGNTGTTTFGIIDNLTMGYVGNQLTKVEDSGTVPTLSSSADFRNGVNLATEYLYDKNGNLTQDLNKGISKIEYNSLNLPKSLVISNSLGSATNTYVYSAAGQKLTTNKGSFKTDYVGNMIYENGSLKRILVDGGYYENGIYHFYIQDHLGNNRIVANQSGGAIQSTQYYPFGMAFSDGANPSSQPYKYNGKELDTEKGLNLYDYEARQMEPALGRFTTMDPLAEKYYSISPYAYCANNPVKYIDPDGRDWYSYQEEYEYEEGKKGSRIQYKYVEGAMSKKEMQQGGYTNLGKTHSADGTYYSLFGSTVATNSFEGQIYQKIDKAIISNAEYSQNNFSPAWGGEDVKSAPIDFGIDENITSAVKPYDGTKNQLPMEYEGSYAGIYYNYNANMKGEIENWVGDKKMPMHIGEWKSGKAAYHIRITNDRRSDIIHLKYNAPQAQRIMRIYNNLFNSNKK